MLVLKPIPCQGHSEEGEWNQKGGNKCELGKQPRMSPTSAQSLFSSFSVLREPSLPTVAGDGRYSLWRIDLWSPRQSLVTLHHTWVHPLPNPIRVACCSQMSAPCTLPHSSPAHPTVMLCILPWQDFSQLPSDMISYIWKELNIQVPSVSFHCSSSTRFISACMSTLQLVSFS